MSVSEAKSGDSPPVIMVIDDSALERKVITRVLRNKDYEVVEVDAGEKALKMVEKVKPDLILLDIMMRGINGIETCRRLKEMKECTNVGIIFMTSRTDSTSTVEAFNQGASDYITKPYRVTEVMARIETQLKIRSLLKTQEQYIDALQQANTEKSKFLGIASHDLKNPLLSINGVSKFLRSGKFGSLNEVQKEMVDSILEASGSMLSLVNDLFDVALIESGQLYVEVMPNDLAGIVRTSTNLFRMTAEQKDIALEYKNHGIPDLVPCDKRQIKRVVENLLSNAIKFSPSGTMIHVKLLQEGDEVCFRVCDQGPGIPENEHHLLFKSFSKTSVKPSGDETSTGLGLNICRKVIHAHGGRITAENRPEGGACFAFWLKAKREQTEEFQ